MRRVVTYYAFDGKPFNTEPECRKYEKKKKDLQKAYRAIDTLKNYCKGMACPNCSFFDFDKQCCKLRVNTPSEWEV